MVTAAMSAVVPDVVSADELGAVISAVIFIVNDDISPLLVT